MGGGKYIPSGKGLYYSDDDAFLDDIFDDDYVEKNFSSIPDEPACDRNRNRIMGGPQPPSPNASEEEKKSYERKQKAFTDANRCKLLAALSSVDMNVSPQKQVMTGHSGDQFPHIRLMAAVENSLSSSTVSPTSMQRHSIRLWYRHVILSTFPAVAYCRVYCNRRYHIPQRHGSTYRISSGYDNANGCK